MATEASFRPALLVVDCQEDFCPPNGSLAVPDGRSVAPVINNLLSLPFRTRIATKDWHPRNHISFASNHPPPSNTPFTSFATITNPRNKSETVTTRLWPDHCIQGTPGAELIPELDVSKLDQVVEKGQDPLVEMYSAFAGPFHDPVVSQSGLAEILKKGEITHVYVVGLAMDYCVKWTAIDAAKEGFKTVIVNEGTKAVGGEGEWDDVVAELKKEGVEMVSVDGEELKRVKESAKG
ncbi:isochorismatase [Rhizodiscina lignyota]|uniref:nicotinamidase n=1 Tax=Rhizodiscina lignyota TaxID=1504668 RepID=A0A9P4M0H0_9PEZI|nr:isochorismatase [Rhizodiscina lignyota]